MRYVCLTGLLLWAPLAWSQNDPLSVRSEFGVRAETKPPAGKSHTPAGRQTDKQPKFPNPFAKPAGAAMEMMGAGAEFEYGMEDMMEMGGMKDEMGGMAGMGMGYGQPSPNELFRRGLQRAIHSLKKAKSDEESEALRGYVRAAFSERYDKMISGRKRDIERLKTSIAKLESDLKRRETAKERVVQLQLQSVQLAAEGLLDLRELQGVAVGGGGGMESGDMYGEMENGPGGR